MYAHTNKISLKDSSKCPYFIVSESRFGKVHELCWPEHNPILSGMVPLFYSLFLSQAAPRGLFPLHGKLWHVCSHVYEVRKSAVRRAYH